MGHMFNFGFRFGYPLMIVMTILRFLVLFGAVYLIAKLITNNNSNRSNFNGGNDSRAIDILKERYAKGEISEEEYNEKMKKLRE